MGCIVKCGFKLVLIAMSIIFVLGGIFFIIFGFFSLLAQNLVINMLNLSTSVTAYYDQIITEGSSSSFVSSTGVALIVMGFIMIFLGFLAWMGGCCGCRLCLLAFAIAMMALLALVVALLIVVALQPSKYQAQVSVELYTNLEQYSGNGLTMPDGIPTASANTWDQILDNLQIQNECCGSYGYTDWNATYPTGWDREYIICTIPGNSASCTSIPNAVVPLSCCKTTNPLAATGSLSFTDPVSCMQTADPTYTYEQGCNSAVNNAVNQFSNVIIPTCVVIMIIGVLNIVASCYVFRHTGLII